MLRQDIKFVDYNGNERTITEYFHLNETEIIKMQAASVNGIQADMQEAVLSNDAARVYQFIEDLVHKSYGKKSQDGLNFDKSPEILNKFVTSAYYADFMLGLIENNGLKGQEFVQGIMPAKLVERAAAKVQGQDGGEVDRTIYGQSARETFAAAQAAKTEGAFDVNTTQSQQGAFGQPTYPQFTQPEQPLKVQDNGPSDDELARFREWQAQQDAAKATQVSSAPVSPDAFRVREEEPMQGLPRPPHEQLGDAR